MDRQINSTSRPDILVLALARHDGMYSSTAWSLAKAFSKCSRVIYVDNPFTVTDLFNKIKREQIKKRYWLGIFRKKNVLRPLENGNLQVVVPPVVLPKNWLPNGRLYRMLSEFNNWLLKRAVNEVLEKNQFRSYLYLNIFNSFYGGKADFTPSPSKFIYQTVDEIECSNYISKHGPRQEWIAMKNADIVVATSRQLQKKAAAISKLSVYIPNAADVDLFRQALDKELPVPQELKGEKRKVICYTGHVDKRLDYGLLVDVAKQHPEKLFLMIGPVSGLEVESSGFAGLPNVKFTGKKDLTELPAYLKYVHCTIIPFKCNALTASIYPLKINEYLSAGKGVVATPFSDDIKDFGNVIELADTAGDFAMAIERVISYTHEEVMKGERLKRALQNTWKARVETFYKLMENEKNSPQVEEEKEYEETVK